MGLQQHCCFGGVGATWFVLEESGRASGAVKVSWQRPSLSAAAVLCILTRNTAQCIQELHACAELTPAVGT